MDALVSAHVDDAQIFHVNAIPDDMPMHPAFLFMLDDDALMPLKPKVLFQGIDRFFPLLRRQPARPRAG